MTLYDDPDRSASADRQVTNWPLPQAEYLDLCVTDSDLEAGGIWPPLRFSERSNRYEIYDRAWRGDFSPFVTDSEAARVVANWIRRITQIIASLMTTSGPVDELQRAAKASIMNMRLYGRAFGVRIDDPDDPRCQAADGPVWMSPRTSKCFPHENGGLVVIDTTFSTGNNTQVPDRMLVDRFMPDGMLEREVRLWTPGNTIMQVLESRTVAGDSAMVDAMPDWEGHGESRIDDLIPLTVLIALRLTGANSVLAANEHPTTVIPTQLADLSQAFAGSEDEVTALSQVSRIEAEQAVQRLRQYDTVLSTGGQQKGYVLEWSGNLGSSIELMQLADDTLSMLTGLPVALLTETGVTSGTALREQHLLLWADTIQEHREQVAMWERLYGGDPMWPNAFDVPIGGGAPAEASEMVAEMNEDMEQTDA